MPTQQLKVDAWMNYHLHFKEMEMVSVGIRLRAGSRGSYPFDGNTFVQGPVIPDKDLLEEDKVLPFKDIRKAFLKMLPPPFRSAFTSCPLWVRYIPLEVRLPENRCFV